VQSFVAPTDLIRANVIIKLLNTMVQSFPDSKRHRGFVLTLLGLQKLQARIQVLEIKTGVHQGARAIADRVQLIEPDGIHPVTVRKLLRGEQGVDKRSLNQVFEALHLSLEAEDYAHVSLVHSKILAFAKPPAKIYLEGSLGKKILPLAETHFYGRTEERSQLRDQVLTEQCRLVAVLGAAGIGKTSLVKKLTVEVESSFECLVWKSLYPAPTLAETLENLLRSLFEQLDRDMQMPTTVAGLMAELLQFLQKYRCLLVLDGIESVFDHRLLAGYYREGYEQYGELFRVIAESCHSSCLILTSQEKPRGLRRFENQSVHLMQLQGLNTSTSEQLMQNQGTFTRRSADLQYLLTWQ
jgi:NACHT domain